MTSVMEAHVSAGSDIARLLIIDDHPLFREALQSAVQMAYPHAETVEARSIAEALEALGGARSFDMALLDLNMPHWDGWTAFTQLERVEPLLPIIVITARPNQYEVAVRLGVDAFMEKPLDFRVLLAAIASLTNEHPAVRVKRVTQRDFVTRHLRPRNKESCP